MKPVHEKLAIATLAGLLLVGAAAFVITPAHADGHKVITLSSTDWVVNVASN